MSAKYNPVDSDDLEAPPSRSSHETVQNKTADIPFCGCLSVQYYQPYFDVDTVDIVARVTSSFLFCNRETNFLNLIADKPDAYGPIWVQLISSSFQHINSNNSVLKRSN
jgi:hypothetical protein